MNETQSTAQAGQVQQDELRVIKHVENGARNIQVYVHFGPVTFPDGEYEVVVASQNNPEYVRFSFDGEAGARVRIEIRSGSRIVYREEGQIADGHQSYATKDHRFRL